MTEELDNMITLAVDGIPICGKIQDLESVLKEIENREGFIKWAVDPLEQLDEAIGSMINPDKEVIPPTIIYYICDRRFCQWSVNRTSVPAPVGSRLVPERVWGSRPPRSAIRRHHGNENDGPRVT